MAELWWPEDAEGAVPIVVLVHGGYWRAPYTKRLMRRLARSVTDEGWAVWNIEYRRVGRFGGGGGWPETFDDVAGAVDALAHVPGIDLDRVVGCGHSAGGQLALWLAARPRIPAGAPGASPRVRLAGAVSLAGVVDLVRAADLGLGRGAVPALLGGGPAEHPDRYALASPAALLPLGVAQVLVHGLDDTIVPPLFSEQYCAAAVLAGETDIRYLPLAGVDHAKVIDPRSPAWPPIRDSLRRLIDGDPLEPRVDGQ